MEEVKTNNNIAYRCHYDVVWCPKYRRDVIRGAVEDRLKQIIGDVCTERAATIIELETMPDHVHLLVSVDPQYGIHRLVKQIKGRSSRLLREGSHTCGLGSRPCGRTRTSSPPSAVQPWTWSSSTWRTSGTYDRDRLLPTPKGGGIPGELR